jgi:hypothetical protein
MILLFYIYNNFFEIYFIFRFIYFYEFIKKLFLLFNYFYIIYFNYFISLNGM